MAKIRTEILIESNESLTVKRKRYSIRAFCDECQRVSIMVVPTEAAFLTRRDINSIVLMMFSSLLHTRCFGENGFFICLTSLCMLSFEDEDMEKEDNEILEITTNLETRNYSFINEE